MPDYEGQVIHRSRDRYGELVVADGALTRTLYFGKGTKQSSMFIDDPAALAMYYMRAMMSALIFNGRPERALFIGLGGGTTVKFLMRACPDCLIEAVEIRGEVIRLAHEYFALPKNHPGVRIIHDDGRTYLLQARDEAGGRYDHIFVDAFDDSGPVASVTDPDFLRACRHCLGPSGVLTFDLWTGPEDDYARHRDLIRSVFQGAILELVRRGTEDNALVFAFKDRSVPEGIGRWLPAAHRLQSELSLNFSKFLEDMFAPAVSGGETPG
jgi:spermidine synthase